MDTESRDPDLKSDQFDVKVNTIYTTDEIWLSTLPTLWATEPEKHGRPL